MFAKTLVIATLSLVTLASAQANELTLRASGSSVSALTRAEVRDAAIQANRDGLLHRGDSTVFVEPTGMAKTRAQVVAETLEAIRLGLGNHGDQNFFFTAAQLESIRLAGLAALPMNLAVR